MSSATADYGARIQVRQGGNELIIGSGSSFSIDAGVTINGALATETIPIPLDSFRIISSTGGEMFSSANNGYLSSASTPALNLASTTDRTARIAWSSGSVIGIQAPSILPPSNYTTATGLAINLLIGKSASSGTGVTVDAQFWPGLGQTESGTVTGAITSTAPTLYSVAVGSSVMVSASNGGSWTLALVPSTHDADQVYLYGVSLSYARQS